MPLSEYEQRVLQQMEQQLRSDDPKLAHTLAERPRVDIRRLIGGILLVAVGLGLLVGGVASGMTWLGVLGFVAMLGGVMLSLTRKGGAGGNSDGGGGGGRGGPARPAQPSGGGFMKRQEDRWERRRDDQGR
ncbi:DUF3040 domain-containing protein [Georgenia sp. 10Sc9-8]|uniref:DUF3040 domain-containing protein n=1 Tax=Georgenia halotolerans TaxID=3028317 RepID=A0ABT5U005_9MICO|nr:DUF3040 domain-containing protein [Georgenia halotolerans]